VDNDIWDRRLHKRIERLVNKHPYELVLELKGSFPDIGVHLATATEILKEHGYCFQFAQSEGPHLIRARYARRS
jgi:hypothetical protein